MYGARARPGGRSLAYGPCADSARHLHRHSDDRHQAGRRARAVGRDLPAGGEAAADSGASGSYLPRTEEAMKPTRHAAATRSRLRSAPIPLHRARRVMWKFEQEQAEQTLQGIPEPLRSAVRELRSRTADYLVWCGADGSDVQITTLLFAIGGLARDVRASERGRGDDQWLK